MEMRMSFFWATIIYFNRADCLRHCYESLRRQTCRDFIWLVVDDGSIDGTEELVLRRSQKRNCDR